MKIKDRKIEINVRSTIISIHKEKRGINLDTNYYAQRREQRKKEIPSSISNVKHAKIRPKSKEKMKQAWSFYLSKAEREKLDEMAFNYGFVKPGGTANVSALLSAWINDEI